MSTQETRERLMEVKNFLQEKGVSSGFFYSSKGASGLKLSMENLEKLLKLVK